MKRFVLKAAGVVVLAYIGAAAVTATVIHRAVHRRYPEISSLEELFRE